jgi:urease accessory protein
MLKLTRVLGNAAQPALADRLHSLAHQGAVEYITLRPEDVARRRLHVHTDRGTETAIVLGRAERLESGAVLLLEPERAVVVRLEAPRWIGLRPRDAAAALEVGYTAGNMHWKVRFEGQRLWVRAEGDPASYRARVAHLIADGRVELIDGAPNDGGVVDAPVHAGEHDLGHEDAQEDEYDQEYDQERPPPHGAESAA